MSFLNELRAINHSIPWQQAVTMVNAYNQMLERLLGGDQHLTPETLLGYETFDAADLQLVINQPGCVGLRIYSGINAQDFCIRCIVVGVDANGQDVIMANGANSLVLCMEEGQRYP